MMDRFANEQDGDDRILDLLVDGELDEARFVEAIRRLDREPDGWKRCALAFLEAQSISAAFRPERGTGSRSRQSSARPLRGTPGRIAVLAAAAGIAIAFWVGRLFPAGRGPELPASGPDLQGAAVPIVAQRPSGPAGNRTEPSIAGVIVLKIPGNGPEGNEIRVPLLDAMGSGAASEWLREAIRPSPLANELARAGHEVRERRTLIPILLDDGREIVLPLGEVESGAIRPAFYR
jgi:hypothetical protein